MDLLLYWYLFLFIDCVIDYELGVSIKVYKNIIFNEFCFIGYFLDYFIFLGVLILEVMVQVVGIFGFKIVGKSDKLYLYVGIDNVCFKCLVILGDRFDFEVCLVKECCGIWKFKGVVSVDGEEVCSVEFMCVMREK